MPDGDGVTKKSVHAAHHKSHKSVKVTSGESGLSHKSVKGSSPESALSIKALQDELQAFAVDLGSVIKSDMHDLSAVIKSDIHNLLQEYLQSCQFDDGVGPSAKSGHTTARRISDIGPINVAQVSTTRAASWDDGDDLDFTPNLMTYGAAVEMDRGNRHRVHNNVQRHSDEPRAKRGRQEMPAGEGPTGQATDRDRERRGKDGKGKRERKQDAEGRDDKGDSTAANKKKRNKNQVTLDVSKDTEAMKGVESYLASLPVGPQAIGRPAEVELEPTDEQENSLLQERSPKEGSRGSLAALVKNPGFDIFFAVLTMVNTGMIGLQTAIMAKKILYESPGWCQALEVFFALCFTVELLLRMSSERYEFFIAGRRLRLWNVFDVLAVAAQLAEMVMLLQTSDHTHLAFNIMRSLRILRALRVLRRYNIESRIGELNTLVVSLMGSAKAFLLACMVMFLVVYLLAVFLTILVLDHRSGVTNYGQHQNEVLLERYYGTLPLSVLTLFQTISGGLEWSNALDPLYESISDKMSIVFSLYIAFVVFAVMNVITGVFVEAALDNARSERDSVTLTMVRNFMKTILLESHEEDTTEATVTYEKFKAHLNDDWMQRYFKSIDLDVSEAKGLFQLLDIEGNGEVLAEEFLSGCMALRGPARSLDLRIVRFESKRFQKKVEKHARLVERHLAKLLSDRTTSDRTT